MPMLTPDPTFYPSPTMAAQSPPEKFAYLALINPSDTGRADAIGVVDLDPDSNGYGRLVGQTDMPTREMNCTTSVGTRAAPASARMRHIRIWSGAIWWCRVFTRRGFTFWTRSPIRGSRGS